MTQPANKGVFNEGHHEFVYGEYKPAEYQHQEYPKAGKDADGNDVLINSADEEPKGE